MKTKEQNVVINENSEMFARGFSCGCDFSYIPTFLCKEDKINWEAGYGKALKVRKKID